MARPTASRGLATVFAATACIWAIPAAAADASPADQALAQSLFDEARKLMARGDYASACPKFAESERLDPGGGTLLNLALCHEGQGKTASAWTEFNDALSRAIRDGRPEREARARERIAALAPKLSRLTVRVAAGAPADLEVTVDGSQWGSGIGVAVPLDPGPHTIVARAATGAPWSTKVALGPNSDAKTVVVPVPGSAAANAAQPVAVSEPESSPAPTEATEGASSDGLRKLGWIAGGVGVAGIATGAVFGLLADGKWNQQKSDCQSPTSCSDRAAALSDHSSMVTFGTVSTVGFIAGGVLLAGGAALLLTAPGSTPPSAARLVLVPAFGLREAMLGVKGGF
jgi:hypothetical protein